MASVGPPSPGPDDHAARTMLDFLTGAWVTQAISTCVEFALPDRLSTGPADSRVLATDIGADPAALHRLLRFLVGVGILAGDEESGYRNTALSELLRSDVPGSMRDLALIYGGAFYDVWGRLSDAVRTGDEQFTAIFGSPFFEYLDEHPELSRTFERAMEAGSHFLDAVPRMYDFTSSSIVVDIGGGSGVLLERILRSVPHAYGILYERPAVLPAAARRLVAAGQEHRCELAGGDMFEQIPSAGDTYVLCRVLHDWNDAACARLLGNCAAVMERGQTLLVIERLLPSDGSLTMASYWDLHMLLCNPGARERTWEQYRELLASAGFTIVGQRTLPLELRLIQTVRR
ncbi:methyltransferase [Actinobacteria bacterium YIM 96077]|uniref:Methyltransferase n=1 Tax=Phytoactinopolyspora halophila TaxID=1981511 RepID=A0A329QLD2_9ACTN|nr:methyltransferase [Phytoactinopolyspora halophila]AYY14779.1 methyltransferase [Actinobacteria bacterium YIM 96077]RAW13053.1 methyltransferase [Phytoactinopolyspora halophila]